METSKCHFRFIGDIILNNKLGINNEIELAKTEEKITKIKALELFDKKIIDNIEV